MAGPSKRTQPLKHIKPALGAVIVATAQLALAGKIDLGEAARALARTLKPCIEFPDWPDVALSALFIVDGDLDRFPSPTQRENWDAATFDRMMGERATLLDSKAENLRAAFREILRRLDVVAG
jgi:hypothetical protein